MIEIHEFRAIQGFSSCSEQEVRALLPCCRTTRYARFQMIYDECVPTRTVYAVLKGEVVLHKTAGAAGKPVRLAVVRPGEMFGFGEIMLPYSYTSASTSTACLLVEIDKEDFIHRVMAVASIREFVMLEMSRIARYLMHHVVGGDALEDLAAYLLTQSRKYGQRAGEKIRLQQKQRQPEIASVLNLSREHVTRLFAKLKAQGVVDFNRGYPVIDHAWLEQAVRDKDMAASIQYRDSLL